MKLNFKETGYTFRFIKDGDSLYFYHPEGLIIFKKENISKWIYKEPCLMLKTKDWDYVFASNIGRSGKDKYSTNKNIVYSISHAYRRSEYWLCPKGISNLIKLVAEL